MSTVTIGVKTWDVEVARTYTEIVTGLSGRQSIPANTGMIFDMGRDYNYLPINMQQMLFSLDIAFIHSSHVVFPPHTVYKVAGILGNVAPGQEASYQSETPCDIFLEVNAGEASGIMVGDNVLLDFVLEQQQGFDISLITPIITLMMTMMIVVMMVKMVGKMGKNV